MQLHRRPPPPTRAGFTLLELMIVVVMVGIMTAIAFPKMRVSHAAKVRGAAYQLSQDLELVRTRALATKRYARLRFNLGDQSYTGYLASVGDSTFAHSASETAALRVFASRAFEHGVVYGRGVAPDLPGDERTGVVTLAGDWADFDSRGTTRPFGERGTIYLTHPDEPDAVAAVSVSAGASFRIWLYQGGEWK